MCQLHLDSNLNNHFLKVSKNQHVKPLKTAPLDKLAQVWTSKKVGVKPKQTLTPIQKRAQAKFLTDNLIENLLKTGSSLSKSYTNTLNCASVVTVTSKDGVTSCRSSYCKNRWCLVCSRIYTATMINKYGSFFETEFKNPVFVTLTIPNVNRYELRSSIKKMQSEFLKIKDKWRKRQERIKKDRSKDFHQYQIREFKAVTKLECTYNATRVDFHPHLHIICEGSELGNYMIDEWLQRFEGAKRSAQDLKKATKGSIKELFKYSTKMLVKTDLKLKSGTDREKKKASKLAVTKKQINIEALDVMFRSMYNTRLLRLYGLSLPEIEETFKESDLKADEIENVKVSEPTYYVWSDYDWYRMDIRTGKFYECLSSYEPGRKERAFIDCIVTTMPYRVYKVE